MVEVLKITATSFKRSHARTAALSAPSPAAGHRWPTPQLETLRHSQASLGQSLIGLLLLSPGSSCPQGSVYALQESVSLVLCKFWQLYVGLMATSSKRAYATPRSAAPRAPDPAAGHCWPVPPRETLKHSSVSVPVGSLNPGVHKVCLSPLSVSGGYGVWFSRWFHPSYQLAGAYLLPLDVRYLLKDIFNILEQLCTYKSC